MAKLDLLCIHCTASPEGRDITPMQLKQIHLGPRKEKDGTFFYFGKAYKRIEDLPNEYIGGISLRELALKYPGRGWKQVGYSDLIPLNGSIINLVPYDADNFVQPREMTNGALGINGKARHVVYAGGCDKNLKPKDTRTPQQITGLAGYVKRFLIAHPDARVGGHNQFAVKACPSFDVPAWLRTIGVEEKNICQEKLQFKL